MNLNVVSNEAVTTAKSKKESNVTFFNFKTHRSNIVAETEKGLLIKVKGQQVKLNEEVSSEDWYFWVAKKFTKVSNYSLIATIGLIGESEYEVLVDNEVKYKPNGKQLWENLPKSWQVSNKK